MKRLVALMLVLVSASLFHTGCGKSSSSAPQGITKPEEVQMPTIPPEVQKQLGVTPAAAPPTPAPSGKAKK